MKVYVQKNESNNCANINFAVALDGFDKMGWEIVTFHSLDQLSGITKEDLFVGYVDETKKIFKTLNVEYEDIDCYPPELKPYLGLSLIHI